MVNFDDVGEYLDHKDLTVHDKFYLKNFLLLFFWIFFTEMKYFYEEFQYFRIIFNSKNKNINFESEVMKVMKKT